jgi:hypothetical protein
MSTNANGQSSGDGWKPKKPKCMNPNCKRQRRHQTKDCWLPGGAKEGQGLKQQAAQQATLTAQTGGAHANMASMQQNYAFSVATDFAQITNTDLPHVTHLLNVAEQKFTLKPEAG